jgi:maleate cis-trans isomerase
LAIECLAVSKPVDRVELPDYSSHKVASELFRAHPEVESLLPQGHWRRVAYMQQLENDTDRSVVSSAAASIRWVMKTLGMKVLIRGYGRLLS